MNHFLLILICLFFLFLFGVYIYLSVGAILLRTPFVRSKTRVAQRMVEIANIQQGQVVYDLGCGDGKILFFASQKTDRCIGVERMRPLIWWGKIRNLFHKKKVEFRCENFFKTDLSDADVIFCYLLETVMQKFYDQKWNELKEGTKVISNVFQMKDLKPVESVKVKKKTVYVYVKN